MIGGPFLIIRKGIKPDPNATAFLQVTGITDPTISSAINTLCRSLKNAGLWNSIYMLKPYVGGTAVTHSYNLINTALYQSTFAGGVTHNANGVTYNGTNGYQNQNFNPLSVGINRNSFAYTIYSATQTITGTANKPFGIRINNLSAPSDFTIYLSGANYLWQAWDTSANGLSTANFLGQTTVQRNSSTNRQEFKNGAQTLNFTANVDALALPNVNFFEGAENGTSGANGYAGYNCRLTSISLSRTASEEQTFYNIIQTFQTTLGRQV